MDFPKKDAKRDRQSPYKIVSEMEWFGPIT